MAMLNQKRCNKCGGLKSIDDFDKNKKCVDGHVGVCKDCRREQRKQVRNSKPMISSKLIPANSNSELARFTPRQLMEELKARGYTGELQYIQKIKL